LYFSDVSTIFYTIYKNQQNGNTIEVVVYTEAPRSSSKFTSMPSVHRKVPRKNSILAIRSSGCRPPAALPDSGEVAAGVGGGEKVGEASWLT
jgi:hypothetical protein